ncbi:peptidylprolyl isomerase [uncultured Ferrimonas sp.]|uniref:peptidylprolyl isomerase n=1 Tax=uncultured Ferrimonas sp. TaxID=432640 RepID=UPI0026199644|nr:peptidylprolyl isomerase [uncultured Ferrimonas sp.]
MRALCTLLLTLCLSAWTWADDIQSDNLFPVVEFDTSKGKIVVELDRSRAPLTVDNFLRYVVAGSYNNTVFHRVIADFVVQGGGYDPKLNEIEEHAPIVNESGSGLSNALGTIAMARSNDPHSATSQFYFNVADNYDLDPSSRRWGYAVFGEVSEGEAILLQLSQVTTEFSADLGAPNVPVEPLLLHKVVLRPE